MNCRLSSAQLIAQLNDTKQAHLAGSISHASDVYESFEKNVDQTVMSLIVFKGLRIYCK